MDTNTVVWVVVGIVVVLALILGAAFFARSARDKKRTAEADRIREEVREENARVEKREAIAAETEAKARAAAAEAEAKAAEAARLADRAATHRDAAASSREDLDARSEHADSIDPRLKRNGRGDVDGADAVEGDRADYDRTDYDRTDGRVRDDADVVDAQYPNGRNADDQYRAPQEAQHRSVN